MSARRALLTIQAETDRAIDALQRPVRQAVVASFRRHADGAETVTPLIRSRVLRDADRALAEMYGAYAGSPASPLYRLVLRQAQRVAAVVLRRAVEDVRYRLRNDDDVLAAIEREAA